MSYIPCCVCLSCFKNIVQWSENVTEWFSNTFIFLKVKHYCLLSVASVIEDVPGSDHFKTSSSHVSKLEMSVLANCCSTGQVRCEYWVKTSCWKRPFNKYIRYHKVSNSLFHKITKAYNTSVFWGLTSYFIE